MRDEYGSCDVLLRFTVHGSLFTEFESRCFAWRPQHRLIADLRTLGRHRAADAMFEVAGVFDTEDQFGSIRFDDRGTQPVRGHTAYRHLAADKLTGLADRGDPDAFFVFARQHPGRQCTDGLIVFPLAAVLIAIGPRLRANAVLASGPELALVTRQPPRLPDPVRQAVATSPAVAGLQIGIDDPTGNRLPGRRRCDQCSNEQQRQSA